METEGAVPAQVYMNLLDEKNQSGGNIPFYRGNPVQVGHGFFDTLGRTIRRVIYPNLVRLGRLVVGDVVGGRVPFSQAATSRTMDTLGSIVDNVQSGSGKSRTKRGRKAKAPPKRGSRGKKRKATTKSPKRKRRRSVRGKTKRRKTTISIAKLLKST